jgi:MFS family permease
LERTSVTSPCDKQAETLRTPSGRFIGGHVPFPFRNPALMWRHIYTGAMGSIYFSVVTGLILTAYGDALGLSYRSWGILSGFASFAIVFQLLGAHISARRGERKGVWFICAMGERLARGGAIVAAFYLARTSVLAASAALVFFMALSSALGAMATPPWFSWLADLMPESEQGSFLGRREGWVSLATVAVLVPSAMFVDHFRGSEGGLPVYLAVFAFALLLGYVDLFIHRTIPEPPLRKVPRRRLWPEALRVLRDRGFRPWLVFSCAWNFAMSLGAALSGVFFVEGVFRDGIFLGVAVLQAVPLIAQMLTSRYTGRLVDRLGTRRTILLGHSVWAVLIVPWLFIEGTTSAAVIVSIANLVGMPAVSAALNAGTKYVTRFPCPEDRGIYYAISSSASGIAAGLGGIAAGEALELMRGMSFAVGGCVFGGFQVVFAASTVLRLVAVLLARKLPKPTGSSR